MRNCTISAKNINLTTLNIAASPPQASWLALPFWGFCPPGTGGIERGVKTIEDGRGSLFHFSFSTLACANLSFIIFHLSFSEAPLRAFYMQLVTPSVVATAVRTDITS